MGYDIFSEKGKLTGQLVDRRFFYHTNLIYYGINPLILRERFQRTGRESDITSHLKSMIEKNTQLDLHFHGGKGLSNLSNYTCIIMLA